MKVSLTDAGKRFNRDWIFRHLSYNFEEGNSYAIVGPNGSGKSTLLQVLSGSMQVNEGKVEWAMGNKQSDYAKATTDKSAIVNKKLASGNGQVSTDEIFNHVAICAPYLEVVEEMTVKELLEFHHRFKPFLSSVTIDSIISIVGLKNAVHKQIRYYSSGMKQRVKLAQAIFSDVPILLLDEPCTNFDLTGIELYHQLINEYCKNRLVIVSSNDEVEYRFCRERINISDYKN
jgi:ABC-type multidrug transport system ATPase subunit